MPVIAFLTNATFEGWEERLRVFSQALREAGFVEGRNVAIEFHQAEGDADRLSALTADLVRRRVDVIVANGNVPVVAAAATSTIPIVFLTGANPVERGAILSLNRPGGNLTGVTALSDSLGPKRLELLHEIAPAATDIGVLVNPPNVSNELQLRDLEAAARTLRLRLQIVNATTQEDFSTVFESLVRLKVGGLVISVAPIFGNHFGRLGALATRHAIPAIYSQRDFAAGGRLDELQCRSDRYVSLAWPLCGPHSQGRKACRSAVPTRHEISVYPQPQDRQDARPYRPACAARPSRRGHRMRWRSAFSLPHAATQKLAGDQG